MSTPSAPPSQAPVEIYLGKNGETFGPFTVEQYESMRAAPDFSTYAFIWDGRDTAPDWKPIPKAAPAAPPRKTGPSAPPPKEIASVNESPVAVSAAPSHATRQLLRGFDVPGIDALLHDSRVVISGKLMQVTDSGCDLVCPDNVVAPTFGSQSSIVLNLLDPSTGRSQNISARLSGMRRGDGKWSLKVQWNACPDLVVQHLEKSA